MAYARTTDEQLRHFMTVPPPPSYDAAQAAAQHTQGNAHVIAAATRRVQSTNTADEGAPDLSPLPQSLNRPRLPLDKRNPLLDGLPEEAAIVKFQTIVREEMEITVGRIKLPLPVRGNHAFVLRRYDTDAISLTTMYKVAFPGASEDDERREMEWVKSSFDTRNTNGDRDNSHVRLAGQWVSRHLAVHLAPAYNMKALITTLARAVPDPNIEYRKSQRSQQAADEMRQTQAPASAARPAPRPAFTFGAPAPATTTTDEDRLAKRTRTFDAPTSSAPSNAAGVTSGSADTQTYRLEAQTNVTGPFAQARSVMEAEIAAAKQMVIDLRRELHLQSATGHPVEQQGVAASSAPRGVRRSRDEADASGAEASGSAATGADAVEASTRVIRTNKTIESAPAAARAKTFAFNTFIFGLGVGAAALLPSLASQYF